MPTYEYLCEKCGEKFEVYQSIKDEPLKKHPTKCRGKVKRLISPGGGIIFKGSGFYQTDYKMKSAGKSTESKTDSGIKTGSQGKAASDKKSGTSAP
jgi:putative FmdB family regulatory protein